MPLAFFELAGMPSAHTATVVALTTSIYYLEGISTLFIAGIALSIFIIDNVLSVEWSIGGHARVINELLSLFFEKVKFKPLRTRWGHTPGEVLAGAIIGFLMAYIIFKI